MALTMESSLTTDAKAAKTMRRLLQRLLVALALASATTSVSSVAAATATKDKDATSTTTTTSTTEPDPNQCGLYLAISSKTSGERNVWGIYAGYDYDKSGINIGSPDVAINAINLRANNLLSSAGKPSPAEQQRQANLLKTVEFLEESFWVPDALGGKFEVDDSTGERIVVATPGGGFLGAFDQTLINADWNVRQSYLRPRLGEETGVAHPSRGAISPFYNVQLLTTDKIQAGSEIFINYGANWDAEHEKGTLLKGDYARIDETVKQMIEFFQKHAKELDEKSKKEIYNFIIKDVMNAAVGTKKARTVASILPASPDDLHKITAAGGSLMFSQPTVYRNLAWLKSNGRCMDNIQVGASTIPNAGRGAFATRPIAKGGLVGASPLLHIPNKEILDMHELQVTETGTLARKSDVVTEHQLLVNYCYGHPQSTMLFFPTGGVVNLINHADKPNAKLVWSDHPASHHKGWFALEPMELVEPEYKHLGLVMEVVALRDIKPGEEIFLDYGPEWKKAWKAHTEKWQAAIKAGALPKQWPLRANDLNDEFRNKPYRTEVETLKDPYPEQVGLVAFMMLADSEETGTKDNPKTWTLPPSGSVYNPENIFDVVVVDRVHVEDGTNFGEMPYNYTIQWTSSTGEHTFVKNVPHEVFAFADEPHLGDQFVESAFRHYIGIPDEIVPQGPWRNLVS